MWECALGCGNSTTVELVLCDGKIYNNQLIEMGESKLGEYRLLNKLIDYLMYKIINLSQLIIIWWKVILIMIYKYFPCAISPKNVTISW